MERNANGTFALGNSGGPGRKSKAREEKYYQIAMSAVSYKDWREIVRKAAEQAKRGNKDARKWLSDYLMGPPQQRVDLTSGDEPLQNIIRVVVHDDVDDGDSA